MGFIVPKISTEKERSTLFKTFLVHSTIILSLSFTYSVWACFKIYNIEREKIIDVLRVHSERMSSSLMDSTKYTEHMMNYMARQIVLNENTTKDKKYILTLLKSFKFDMNLNRLLSWSTFMWADKNFHIVADGLRGILPNPVDLSRRDYIPETVKYPWTLQIGQPVFGAMSNLWILPAGLGATDRKGNYLGSVVTGFRVDGLHALLKNSLTDPKVSFLLLDNDYVSITNSTDNIVTQVNKDLIKKIETESGQRYGLVFGSSLFSNLPFTFFYRVPKYNLIILTSYDKYTSDQLIWSTIYSQIIENLVLSLAFILSLGLLYYRIFRPIERLARQTQELTKGKRNIRISRSDIMEIDTLANQISHVKDLKNELHDTKDFAEAANAAKTEFLSSTAHELRSPLNAIIGFSGMIKGKVFKEDIDKYAEYGADIEQSGKELLEFISDLLDVSKSESGSFAIEKEEWVDVSNVINRSIKLNISRAHQSDIQIKTHIEKKLPRLYADGRRIRQVMVNLISNAIKYSPEGTRIDIYAKIVEGRMSVVIADQGFGMSEEQINIALTKGGQVKNQNFGKVDSYGLGLPLAKYLAELHGAEFTIDSHPNNGTTIVIVFPTERVESKRK